MGINITKSCTNCGKTWVSDTENFYLMSDDRIEEHPLVSYCYEFERQSVASGWISKYYCRECDKDIKVYLLNEVKTEYPRTDPNKIIEEYKHKPNTIFTTSDEFKEESKIICQKCQKELALHIHLFAFNDNFILNCTTYKAKCDECDEFYTIHVIKPPRRDYSYEEAFEKVEKLKDNDILLYSSDEFETIKEIECPYCNETVHKYDGDTCPKCEGKLEEIDVILYD